MISSVKNDDSFVMKPLDDFSMLGGKLVKPIIRKKGNWIKMNDFESCFQYFQVFYNPSKYKYNQIIEIKQNSSFEITPNFDKEILIVHKNPDVEEDE